MKKYIIVLFAFISIKAMAQIENKLSLTLQQAKELGLKNRYDLKANQYNVLVAQNGIEKTKNEWLPDINATGNATYNTQLKTTQVPAGFGGATEPGTISLGTKNQTVFGLDLNQVIFNPSLSADTKIAKNNTELEQEKNRGYEINSKTQISQSYFNVQLKAFQLKISIDNENRYADYYSIAQATFKAGSLLENDLLKAKLDYENAKIETQKQQQDYVLAQNNLKYQINVPETTELTLTDSLITKTELEYNTQTNRTEIKQLQLQKENFQLQTDKIYQRNLPTLSFLANYSQQYQHENFDYSQNKMWSPFSYLGLKLNVPLSGIYKNSTNAKEFKLKEQQNELLLQQKTAEIQYEIQNTTETLNNALQNMQTTQNNYQLSQTIYNTQKQQYKLGVLLYEKLLDTEKTLKTTEQYYIKSVYDYLVAKVDYQKAKGVL
ncbi:TolC family protein [Flavobacterium psychrophilum]|uniref:TolC family protein n=1 Tax=Flavobacterium psychrophilum TaxID=96345 RepID=UPI000B7C2F5C|nr:TolC family protein [Flavobacterium psychrophilum]EKT4500634.1 TolC family protein [Flavobacterium psychrophilum]MBF2023693.1 TolC family protein [Flavobacterium psychrophilum]MCB5984300.1 TolC family protein [Flavobacterium psychrophilum]MCB5994325.1 TolC family protein [Flavobacterium psychrophilum]MCB5996468.1 TolC family protein [Flavobacterium psychrophilum]